MFAYFAPAVFPEYYIPILLKQKLFSQSLSTVTQPHENEAIGLNAINATVYWSIAHG